MRYLRLIMCFFAISSVYATSDAYSDFLSIGIGGEVQRGICTLPINSPLGFDATFKSQVKQPVVSIGYRREPSEGFYSSVQLAYQGYSSQDIQLTPSLKLDQSEIFYDIDVLFGYTFDLGFNFKITPCIGAGASNSRLRYNYSSLLPTTKAYLSRKWSYYLTGIHLDGSFTKKLAWGVHLHVNLSLFTPKLRVNIVGVKDEKLERKANYRFETPISYLLRAKKDKIRLVPFYASANFGVKKIDLIPPSAFKSYFLGMRLEYLIGF